ncbi:hypothetical protein B0H17DRAFT_1148948 [Mycena rosella]|uniref:Uncharacterized protein n=1 Tax=Mycena rosella TaxID=1033263 RepID=A0AAD7C8G4_MYCRO|nr:hypothetical protein B0H17DRAFT_1148948 [Mycena rosella]
MAWLRGQVEWFFSFRPSHKPNHNMLAISKPLPRADGSLRGSVIYLFDIHQICQLFPNFGQVDVNPQWTSDNVLATQYFLIDHYTFQIFLMYTHTLRAKESAEQALEDSDAEMSVVPTVAGPADDASEKDVTSATSGKEGGIHV